MNFLIGIRKFMRRLVNAWLYYAYAAIVAMFLHEFFSGDVSTYQIILILLIFLFFLVPILFPSLRPLFWGIYNLHVFFEVLRRLPFSLPAVTTTALAFDESSSVENMNGNRLWIIIKTTILVLVGIPTLLYLFFVVTWILLWTFG